MKRRTNFVLGALYFDVVSKVHRLTHLLLSPDIKAQSTKYKAHQENEVQILCPSSLK
jgi:hypothetical protein